MALPSIAHASTVAVDNGEVHYVAGAGEVNDVVVGHTDASTMTVRDAGALIDARDGCVPVDDHNAICTTPGTALSVARVETGDMNDRIRSYGNAPPVLDPALVANGGPGDDELIGGESGDYLDGGGGGHERIFGVVGDDVITDGDGPGEHDDDVLEGGPGIDTLAYSSRSTPLVLTLGKEYSNREGDWVRTIENVMTGSGADRITGDGYANVLSGGAGADDVFCGDGADTAHVNLVRDFVAPDCERVAVDHAKAALVAKPYPSVGRSVRFRLGCPPGGGSCSGKLTLRAGNGKRLGSGPISKRSKAKPVKVKLTKSGRRLAKRRKGVLATVTLKGKRLPSIGWTIRLRLRRLPT